jgi:hypothetical protein
VRPSWRTRSRAATIEDATTADPDLALLADLANQRKHVELKRARSGSFPAVGRARGVRDGSGAGGWTLDLPIHHAGFVRDGYEVAKATTVAWRAHLLDWGLV